MRTRLKYLLLTAVAAMALMLAPAATPSNMDPGGGGYYYYDTGQGCQYIGGMWRTWWYKHLSTGQIIEVRCAFPWEVPF